MLETENGIIQKRTRISVTLTKHYSDFLDDVTWHGVYPTKGAAIMAAIRLLMKEHGAFYILEKIEEAEE